jgi:hypothetical protein
MFQGFRALSRNLSSLRVVYMIRSWVGAGERIRGATFSLPAAIRSAGVADLQPFY